MRALLFEGKLLELRVSFDPTSMKKAECSVKFTASIPNVAQHQKTITRKCAMRVPLVYENKLQFTKIHKLPEYGGWNSILTVVVQIEVTVSINENPWTPTSTIQSNILKMFEDEKMTDVEFHVGNEQRIIRAHSLILMARTSTAMQDIIELAKQDMLEEHCSSNPVVIQLPDVDPDHFQSMLRFIYADDISFLKSGMDSKKFLTTANRFGYWELKMQIEAKLIQDDLTFETSIELLFFADAQDCFMLREACIFQLAEHFPELIRHSDFHKLYTSSELFQEAQRCEKNDGGGDGTKDAYSDLTISELYRELEKKKVTLDSDGSRVMLLKQIRTVKKDGE